MLDFIPQAADCGQGGQRIAPESNYLRAVLAVRTALAVLSSLKEA
jgi:hypothetical protein